MSKNTEWYWGTAKYSPPKPLARSTSKVSDRTKIYSASLALGNIVKSPHKSSGIGTPHQAAKARWVWAICPPVDGL
ncbi:hypothetical protein VN97_g1613 [Penicillium thymicola]|uniref:Uncharacterized protein n=1 Tax=Penicillium thymicola TaxID=293382 RepID=A0AAI9TRE6_PENTH|nr:hypothetical protein VN97_g1613 [Penicillium thymicola]